MTPSSLVALTGGIGAGKSTVARCLAEHGARIVDGDDAARTAVDPRTPHGAALLAQIAELLGGDAVTADGTLDRGIVATRIFGDERLRRDYDALLRPAIIAEVAGRITEERRVPGVVVHEIPLLSSRTAPLPWAYDLVVTVEASEDARLARLQDARGYGREEAEARVRAQGSEADRVAIADVVLRTDGTLDETRAAATALWTRLSSGRPIG